MKTKIEQNMNTIFNLEETVENTEIVEYSDPVEDKSDEELLKQDFILARTTLVDLIKSNELALETVAAIAGSTEDPKSFEALSNLMSTQTNIVKELLNSHKKKKEIERLSTPKNETNQTLIVGEKIVFSGSTSDLMKAIKS
jgi:hypothetical protein